MRSCSECIHFRFEVRTVRGKKMRAYWCQLEVADTHRSNDGYAACRAQKPEPTYWEHDPTKRRFWNQYVRHRDGREP